MKKKLILLSVILFAGVCYSQVAVGKASVTNGSVSLEFGDDENKGLILPYVIEEDGITEKGTIIYDTTDHKVKYLKDTNVWFDLSVDTSGTVDLSIQGSDKTEQSGAKVSITTGSGIDDTQGILVLSDINKAMILPKVATPHLNIINPSAGMIVYDTVAHQLAIYNGTVWSFWKP